MKDEDKENEAAPADPALKGEQERNAQHDKSDSVQVEEVVPQVPTVPARIDLRKLFPQSVGMVFCESAKALLGIFALCIGYLFLAFYIIAPDKNIAVHEAQWSAGILTMFTTLYYIGLTVCILKVIYEFLCYLFYEYGIELEHLTVVRGLLFRNRASFPLNKINDLSIQRTPLQAIFGVNTVTVLTASDAKIFGSIEGLSTKNAEALQNYILALMETTLPNVMSESAARTLVAAENVLQNNPPIEPHAMAHNFKPMDG